MCGKRVKDGEVMGRDGEVGVREEMWENRKRYKVEDGQE